MVTKVTRVTQQNYEGKRATHQVIVLCFYWRHCGDVLLVGRCARSIRCTTDVGKDLYVTLMLKQERNKEMGKC